jgi:8-oxo-dGTP pyrophosphatase MutT (NUDIX family)
MNCVPCAGFIIFNSDKTKTVLVETHRGHLGYPKGKRHKDETALDNAMRELNEETGITQDEINILPGSVQEYSRKGNPNIQYFVGILNSNRQKFTFDTEELLSVEWYDVEKVPELDFLRDERKRVFTEVLKLIIAY